MVECRVRECCCRDEKLFVVATWCEVDVLEPWRLLWWSGTRWVPVESFGPSGGYCAPGRSPIRFADRNEADDYIERRSRLVESVVK